MRVALLLIFSVVMTVGFQTPAVAQNRSGAKGLRRLVVHPKKLLKNRKELDLSKQQIDRLKVILKEASNASVDHGLELDNVGADLKKILQTHPVDVDKVESKTRELVAVEGNIKIARMVMFAKTRNVLNGKQIKLVKKALKKQGNAQRKKQNGTNKKSKKQKRIRKMDIGGPSTVKPKKKNRKKGQADKLAL